MAEPRDLSGIRFGRLVGLSFEKKVGRSRYWRFLCDCGKERVARVSHVVYGKSKSCGCLRRELSRKNATIHGLSKMRAYRIWGLAKSRCEDPEDRSFKNYGGRGIYMCRRWRESFAAFIEDMGDAPPGLTLERINNDGPYAPENCKWATRAAQQANRRICVMLEVDGEQISRATFARANGLTPTRLRNVMKERGLGAKDAVRYALSHRKQRGESNALDEPPP